MIDFLEFAGLYGLFLGGMLLVGFLVNLLLFPGMWRRP